MCVSSFGPFWFFFYLEMKNVQILCLMSILGDARDVSFILGNI